MLGLPDEESKDSKESEEYEDDDMPPLDDVVAGSAAAVGTTGVVVMKVALAQTTRRRKFKAFMKEARTAADKKVAGVMGRFDRGEMSEPEGEEATLVHEEVEFPLLIAIDDMECLSIGRIGPRRFVAKFVSVDKQVFTVKCGEENIRGWPSAVVWMRERPLLFPNILAQGSNAM
jgi:hypothetical protein